MAKTGISGLGSHFSNTEQIQSKVAMAADEIEEFESNRVMRLIAENGSKKRIKLSEYVGKWKSFSSLRKTCSEATTTRCPS